MIKLSELLGFIIFTTWITILMGILALTVEKKECD